MAEAVGLSAGPALPSQRSARAGTARFANIQALRAFAACSVMLLHAAILLERLRGEGRFLQVFNVNLGMLGVAVFFAISGFLMAQLVRTTPPSPS